MNAIKTEKLFTAIKETVIALFNVSDEYFVMITKNRDYSYYVCYFYSKSRLEPVEVKGDYLIIRRDDIWESSIVERKEEGITEIESIMLNKEKVYILDGNLMLDRF